MLDPANRDSYTFAIAREFEPVDESDHTDQLRAAIADYPPFVRYQRMPCAEREEAGMFSDLDVLNRALLELLEQRAGHELKLLHAELARARSQRLNDYRAHHWRCADAGDRDIARPAGQTPMTSDRVVQGGVRKSQSTRE